MSVVGKVQVSAETAALIRYAERRVRADVIEQLRRLYDGSVPHDGGYFINCEDIDQLIYELESANG